MLKGSWLAKRKKGEGTRGVDIKDTEDMGEAFFFMGGICPSKFNGKILVSPIAVELNG